MVKDIFNTLDKHTAGRAAHGTSFTRKTIQCTGSDLIRTLGEPTFLGSSDDKVRMEWVLEYNAYDEQDNEISAIITIYDWKTSPSYDLVNSDYDWHIGSKNYNPYIIDIFVEDLEQAITV